MKMSLFPDTTQDYSCSVNPNISQFIEKNKLNNMKDFRDPDQIQYFKKKFENVKKTGPVYAMHRYWTKQPISVIKECIHNFCPPNGLVLDPFCGSGTTGVAALYSNRPVILSDISRISTFISKHYTEKTDISSVETRIKAIEAKISPLLQEFYQSRCITCHKLAHIKDWIYSEVYICPNCTIDLYFVNDNANWEDIIKQKHKKHIFCSHCKSNFGKKQLQFSKFHPLGLRYHCSTCRTRNNFKKLDYFDQAKLNDPKLEKIYERTPYFHFPFGINTTQVKIKKINKTNELFSPVTLYILSNLWDLINETSNKKIRSKLQFIFSSILYRVTRLYRLRVNGQGGVLSGTLYIPALSQDINVWDVFKERSKKIQKGWEELNRKLPESYHRLRLISTHSATDLSSIATESIDYVYTDPPYGGNINYSELNILWESWFGDQTNTEKELIINQQGQQKDINEYGKLFEEAFNEIFRVLKRNHYCTLIFNSSHADIWSLIQDVILKIGFQIKENISLIESKMTTAKQTQSKKTARRYLMIHLIKPSSSTNENQLKLKKVDMSILVKHIKRYIGSLPGQNASYDEIYDYILAEFIPKYQISDFNLNEILNSNFAQKENDIWELK